MVPAMDQAGIHYRVEDDFPDYLRDESRQTGWADSISFPLSTDEIRDHLRYAEARRELVTLQGARTGITAGAVPEGGHVLNLSRMKRLLSVKKEPLPTVVVQPGLSLAEIRTAIREEIGSKWFFPPDPTETSASIGGMIACNASGARSFLYGAVRAYIHSLRVMLIDGSTLLIRRQANRASNRSFEITAECGRRIAGALPSYRLPSMKNASGYFAQDEMDLVDLFVGSEGTLGVVFEAELSLRPNPPVQFGLLAFLPDENGALAVVRRARAMARIKPETEGLAALEFFDERSLALVRNEPAGTELRLPEGPGVAVYLEYHGHQENFLEDRVASLSQHLEKCGADPETAWLATSEKEMERLKAFRHAIPEAVNRTIGERKKTNPGLTKLGTDLAVPDDRLDDVVRLYREGLDRLGLEHVIFGHIGNNHLHVNIIPRSTDEYEKGRQLYREWGRAVVRMGGTVSAEHGIGKLKREMLMEMYGPEGIEEMKRLKACFDPDSLLNRGNLFSY